MHKGFSLILLGALVGGACAGLGCGSSGGGSGFDGGNPDGNTLDGTVDTGRGNRDGGLKLGNGDSGNEALAIKPLNPTLTATGPGATEQFTATVGGASVAATWSLDVAGPGTIDANGLFTASGLVGGPVGVTATSGGQMAQTTLNVVLQLTENIGSVSPGTIAKLGAGGSADPSFAWLYPYDKTVFPRGLPAPTLQVATQPVDSGVGAGFDAAMVKVNFAGLAYTGYYGPGALPDQIPLSATAWNAITLSATGTDAVDVEITEITGTQVTGPIHETWTIATGSLSGSIFYNSYNSILAGSIGAVLKLRPTEQELSVVLSSNGGTTCHVCHAVSANGTMLEASNETSGGAQTDSIWSLTAKGGTTTPEYLPPYRTWDFGAFTPDGKKFLRYGAVPWTSGAWAPDVRGLGNSTTDVPSDLFDPKTGVSLGPKGLNVGPGGAALNMMMPAFSSDGTMVAFTHYDTGLGHTIAVMDFDDATNTFSGLRDIANIPTLYVGWPTFTPDNKYVFFAAGDNDEYSTMSDSPPSPPEPTSNLYIAQVSSATTATADALNGVSGGTSYLPFPDDVNLNYEPTILPVASGGYYWAVFTSRRNYGNTVNGNAYVGPGGVPSPRKKLWVAAIDIATGTPKAAADLTHPAFYLEGQELTPGNMRAFWALDPCSQTGSSCQEGYQCCTGFCRETTGSDGGEAFSCVVPPTGCSQLGEKCTGASSCCGVSSGDQCINGFCAAPSPK